MTNSRKETKMFLEGFTEEKSFDLRVTDELESAAKGRGRGRQGAESRKLLNFRAVILNRPAHWNPLESFRTYEDLFSIPKSL